MMPAFPTATGPSRTCATVFELFEGLLKNQPKSRYRLQHRVHFGRCRSASCLSRPYLRRHGAGDQAGRRAHPVRTRLGARHARHGQARLYPRPHPVVRQPVPCAAGGLGNLARMAEAYIRGESVADAAVLAEISPSASTSRTARRPTSSCSPARTIRSRQCLSPARALAGRLDRPGRGHRPPGPGRACTRSSRHRAACRSGDLHLGKTGFLTRRLMKGFGLQA